MPQVIRLHAPGGADQLIAEDVVLPALGAGQVRVRHLAVGVNFVDIYQRTGLYPLPQWPAVLGVEGAGIIEAIGSGVTGLTLGQSVAWAGGPPGGYAAFRDVAADRLLPIPAGLSPEIAGATLLRAMTAQMVFGRVASLKPGQTVLVQAAAGGLGLMLVQWAKRLGASVIGTVGSAAKADHALAAGADKVVIGRGADFVTAAREWTGGTGVDVVVDGIGGDVLKRSLDAVRLLGLVINVGQAGGGMPAIDIAELGGPRNIGLARPSVLALCRDQALYRQTATEALAILADGVAVTIGARFPLAQAAQAHRALESGATVGSVVLAP